jgi:hypothetical protein
LGVVLLGIDLFGGRYDSRRLGLFLNHLIYFGRDCPEVLLMHRLVDAAGPFVHC